jgi:transcriptional regulator with XRE-family HTH domain
MIRVKISPSKNFDTTIVAKFLNAKKLTPKHSFIMKNQHAIRTLLGITQQDAAMLLGVHRSQWSMFESGKRSLPVPAMQLLAEMLSHVQGPQAASRRMQDLLQYSRQQHRQLENLLRENEYQQALMAKKMAALEKKQAAQLRLSQLADFLNSRKSFGKNANSFHDEIINKAQAASKNISTTVMQCELKQEALILEKLVMESKMRKILLSSEMARNESKL